MICRTCLRRATALNVRTHPPLSTLLPRAFSVSSPSRTSTQSTTQASPASETASPSSMPTLSTPVDAPVAGNAGSKPARPPSSCPPGTVLTGLNYFKSQTDPVALPDEEYPEWLWDCLEFKSTASDEADANAGDEFSKSAKQRRLAAKRQKQIQAKLLAEGNLDALAPKVPLQHQSVNLPGKEDGDVADNLFAAEKREELRKAMRQERKAKIKEANYLKSM
ncbi:hypothetical protein SODALDRAFT_334471 [Sodiomyces alkalinus F11]|uniref:Large ribosomal subunit protein mL54 n=1 Tax=Sodiomyces alkalinus (strain CBS 110278 / VKM F-3762 / F11) TaxID=1314773 RepID=A0A3N2PS86_SODAK|nr:hypothetical protein SODALDRAFT_334471 [Sodiomyces alkalinus F11]ROT37381.1 hypothetical protein SODALDRAFT_334471 [Sodiomyces alkalinus F11]